MRQPKPWNVNANHISPIFSLQAAAVSPCLCATMACVIRCPSHQQSLLTHSWTVLPHIMCKYADAVGKRPLKWECGIMPCVCRVIRWFKLEWLQIKILDWSTSPFFPFCQREIKPTSFTTWSQRPAGKSWATVIYCMNILMLFLLCIKMRPCYRKGTQLILK